MHRILILISGLVICFNFSSYAATIQGSGAPQGEAQICRQVLAKSPGKRGKSYLRTELTQVLQGLRAREVDVDFLIKNAPTFSQLLWSGNGYKKTYFGKASPFQSSITLTGTSLDISLNDVNWVIMLERVEIPLIQEAFQKTGALATMTTHQQSITIKGLDLRANSSILFFERLMEIYLGGYPLQTHNPKSKDETY